MQVSIKKASEKDISTLQNIAITTFKEAYSAQNTAAQMAEYIATHFDTTQIRTELSNAVSAFYLAYGNEDCIGYLKVNFAGAQTELNDAQSLEIERIYVLKTHYGKQIGDILYQKAVEVAQNERLAYIWLGVWEHNPRAIRFYEKMGFERFGTHIFDFNGDAQTDILMRKSI